MMRASRWWAVALLLGSAAACEPRAQPTEEPPEPGAEPPPRPAQLERAVMIEGMPERLRFRLVEAPDDFPLRFSTYVPDDVDAEFDRIETGHVANFPARFGGERTERARFMIHVYPAGTSADQAQSELATYLASLYPDDTPLERGPGYERAVPVEPASRYAWAQDESRYRVPGDRPGLVLSGRAGIGVHADRVFYFILEYPEEFGDGFGPRVEAILDEWRWEDTGERLDG